MILLEIDYFIFSLFNIYFLMIRLFHKVPIKVAKNSVSIELEKLNQDDYCKIMSKINLFISIIYKI